MKFINNLQIINKRRIFFSGGWLLNYTNNNDINHYIYNTRKTNSVEVSYADRPFINPNQNEIIVGLYPKDEIKKNKGVFINYCVKKYYFNPRYKPVNYWSNQDKMISYILSYY